MLRSAPDPEDFRYIEDAARAFLESRGLRVVRTGQEYVNESLGRWSPDFWAASPGLYGFWVDAKVRNPEYRDFLIEWDDLVRHCADFPPTVYILVERGTPVVAGWITADEARKRKAGVPRSDHNGSGSGDSYIQIPARYLRAPAEIDEALYQPRFF